MHASVEIQVVGIGAGGSMREQAGHPQDPSAELGLRLHLREASARTAEDFGEVLEAVDEIVRSLHARGVPRIQTVIKVETRIEIEGEPPFAGPAW